MPYAHTRLHTHTHAHTYTDTTQALRLLTSTWMLTVSILISSTLGLHKCLMQKDLTPCGKYSEVEQLDPLPSSRTDMKLWRTQ